MFEKTGWHLERAALAPETIESAREFLSQRRERLMQQFSEWVGSSDNDYGYHQTQLPLYEQRGLPSDLRHYLTGEFDLETRLDEKITDILSTDGCREFLSGFLGSERYLVHYPPMIRFKVANAPSNLVPVHQDLAYNRHLKNFVTVWVPLTDLTEDCGGVIVYEGSHVLDLLDHKASGAWAEKAETDLTQFPARHILMNTGDALLFAPTLLHQSAPHRARHERYSVDFRIFPSADDTTKSYYDPFTKTVRRLH
jgi:hypothetical protein